MSSNYVVLNNFSPTGNIALSRRLFESIANKAVEEVGTASPALKKNKGIFKVKGPANVIFRKDGKIDIVLEVSLRKDAKVQDVCLQIQQNVASHIQMMCETVPFSIKIRVVSLT